MAQVIKRREVDFDELFKEDADQYYDLATRYLNLTTEDYSGAFDLCEKAWVLADRWNNIAANAGKLANAGKTSKTDLYKYCYGKYRNLQLMHEHTRMIWARGERAVREN